MEEIEVMLRCILVAVSCLLGSSIVYHIFAISEIIERRFEKRRKAKILSLILTDVKNEEQENQGVPDVFAEFEKTGMNEKDEEEWKKHFRDRWEKRE